MFGPGPVRWQVKYRASLRAGQSGGDGDDLAADGGAAGQGVPVAGEGPGGAQQVGTDGGADGPRTIGRKTARRLMGQRSIDEIGEHRLDDGVASVGDVSSGGRFD